jgi:hypothetical protein
MHDFIENALVVSEKEYRNDKHAYKAEYSDLRRVA